MKKKAFAILLTVSIVTIFSFLSIFTLEIQNISSNINTIKYLNVQAKVYLSDLKSYINTHTKDEISNFKLNDKRFDIKIIENNDTTYHIGIKATNKWHVRIQGNTDL